MRCAVHCLVSRPDQLDPLVDRLMDAGVATRDISVVLRQGMQTTAMDAWRALWWPLVWPLALRGGGEDAEAGAWEGGRIVSLAQYQAWRDRREGRFGPAL